MTENQSQTLKNLAKNILNKCNINEEEKFGSIIAILMVISIILTLVRVLQECNKSKTQHMTSQDKYAVYGAEMRTYSKKRGWFTRMRIKRAIRKELTPADFNKYGIKLTEAILDQGEILKDEEVSTLVEAANV